MMYTGYVMPHKKTLDNALLCFDELMVLISSYHLFIFTEWVYSPERRHEMGWSLLSFVALNVGVNFIAMFYIIIVSIKTFFKRYFARRKRKKLFKKMVA